MNGTLEERLAAALHAKADLVQPEDLRYDRPAATGPTPLWRRPVVVALVAAAAVAAVVVPLVLHAHHETDRLPSDRIPTPVHSLSGDVDGDGRPDRLSTSADTLTVTLAADPGHPRRAKISHLVGLVGLFDARGPGHGVVVAESGTLFKGGQAWEPYALDSNGQLGVLTQTATALSSGNSDFTGVTLGVFPGAAVAWISADGVVMSGTLDPLQEGARRLAVRVSRYQPTVRGIDEVRVGDWCWDTATQGVPAPCPAGVTDAYDPGAHGSLPTLLPKARPEFLMTVGSTSDTWHQGSTRLRIVKGPVHTASLFHQVYDVVGTVDGKPVSAPIGTVGARLFETYVDLGHGVRGLAAADDGSATWNLLALTDLGLVPVTVAGGHRPDSLHPGTLGLLVDGKARNADTWIAGGRVFTRLETGETGRYRTYEWQVTDASATTLSAVDLGTVCLDDYWATYGTCSG